MAFDFNVDEIFEMAEEIERNGARFYHNMAEQIFDKAMQSEFHHLAEMEEEHERVFQSMRANLSEGDMASTVFDPEGESTQYLRAMADLRVFDEQTRGDFLFPDTFSDNEKMEHIFRAAIGIEKESIVFYVGMKEFVPENLGKKKIDGIIKEEMSHIRILAKRLSALKR
jgi:rubrerythrin